jgi:prepilin-type processing-associated H-X9-DG protein
LLDDLEQGNVKRQIDFNVDLGALQHAGPRLQTLEVFLCPSDEALNPFVPEGGSYAVAFGSYVGVFGCNEIEADPGAGNGMLFRNSRIRITDVQDGTSNTLFVGERNSLRFRGSWTGVPFGLNEAQALVLGTCDHVPNSPDGHVEDFASRHSYGVNFLFVDGSVRNLDDSIRVEVYWALATRAGGEAFAASDY